MLNGSMVTIKNAVGIQGQLWANSHDSQAMR